MLLQQGVPEWPALAEALALALGVGPLNPSALVALVPAELETAAGLSSDTAWDTVAQQLQCVSPGHPIPSASTLAALHDAPQREPAVTAVSGAGTLFALLHVVLQDWILQGHLVDACSRLAGILALAAQQHGLHDHVAFYHAFYATPAPEAGGAESLPQSAFVFEVLATRLAACLTPDHLYFHIVDWMARVCGGKCGCRSSTET